MLHTEQKHPARVHCLAWIHTSADASYSKQAAGFRRPYVGGGDTHTRMHNFLTIDSTRKSRVSMNLFLCFIVYAEHVMTFHFNSHFELVLCLPDFLPETRHCVQPYFNISLSLLHGWEYSFIPSPLQTRVVEQESKTTSLLTPFSPHSPVTILADHLSGWCLRLAGITDKALKMLSWEMLESGLCARLTH